MKLLLNTSNQIFGTANAFEFGAWELADKLPDGTVVRKWRAVDALGNTEGYYIDCQPQSAYGTEAPQCRVVEVDKLPDDYVSGKYIYAGGFVLNPDYRPAPKTVDQLTYENELLKEQIVEHELSQAETELDIDARLISLELGLV